jgi:hypothetical protein
MQPRHGRASPRPICNVQLKTKSTHLYATLITRTTFTPNFHDNDLPLILSTFTGKRKFFLENLDLIRIPVNDFYYNQWRLVLFIRSRCRPLITNYDVVNRQHVSSMLVLVFIKRRFSLHPTNSTAMKVGKPQSTVKDANLHSDIRE